MVLGVAYGGSLLEMRCLRFSSYCFSSLQQVLCPDPVPGKRAQEERGTIGSPAQPVQL
jgi:hypothetical protein